MIKFYGITYMYEGHAHYTIVEMNSPDTYEQHVLDVIESLTRAGAVITDIHRI